MSVAQHCNSETSEEFSHRICRLVRLEREGMVPEIEFA